MKKWILLSALLLVVTGVAQAIPNPAAVYCILQGYEYEIRTDEQGNQYGVCVFPDGSECGGWDYYRKCELNGIGGDFTCHWPCKEMRCKEAGESVLVSKCCEGLDEIYPAHIFDANCNKLELVGWLFLCSDCGNGICESWESKCNCPEDCAQPRIIYVDADAPGANNGSSWADAYDYLQDALADANASVKPVEIWVAEGNYKPDQGVGITPGDRTATFKLIDGVTLKGGYAGFGEPDANAKDIELYETILSGDLYGDDIDVNDPCDLWNEPSRAENSFHVTTGSGTDETAVLDGFTITAGNAYERPWHPMVPDPNNWGGGMYNHSGSPTLTCCTFIGNSAERYGGGIYNKDPTGGSRPTLTNCTFSGNAARSKDGWEGSGGGMYNSGSSPVLSKCTFAGNRAEAGGGGMRNGAASPIVLNCTFSGNSAGSGGGMSNLRSSPTVTVCAFSGNSADNVGGGMDNRYESGPTVTNCWFSHNSASDEGGGVFSSYSSPMLTNCVFIWNSAEEGGGMYNTSHNNSTLINCTFGGNAATNGSALACDSFLENHPSSVELANCILWGGGDEIWNNDGSAIEISFSDVQGGWAGEGNIDDDPCFADANNGDYHLKSQAGRWEPSSQSWVVDEVTSPCIDAGNTMSPIGDEPFPNGGRINMGAYGGTTEASKSYFGESVCETIVAGDINGDCKVNFLDFRLMALHWLRDENQ